MATYSELQPEISFKIQYLCVATKLLSVINATLRGFVTKGMISAASLCLLPT